MPSQILTLWLKDVLLEWRTRARMTALVFFALSTLLVFSFALGPDPSLLAKNAGGYLWLSVLFASALSLSESFRIERENGAIEGLLLIPVNPRALFIAKAAANASFLLLLSVAILPILLGVFGPTLSLGAGRLLEVLALGCLAISAPGTLYAAIATHARAREVLLPLMLFPVLIPVVAASAKATGLVFDGDPMAQLGSWLGLLFAFNLVYWGLGVALFPKVIDVG